MGAWYREDGEMVWKEPDPPRPEVDVTENPVVAELLGPKGETVRQWRERPSFGFQKNRGH